jgi:hypothetical protein
MSAFVGVESPTMVESCVMVFSQAFNPLFVSGPNKKNELFQTDHHPSGVKGPVAQGFHAMLQR